MELELKKLSEDTCEITALFFVSKGSISYHNCLENLIRICSGMSLDFDSCSLDWGPRFYIVFNVLILTNSSIEFDFEKHFFFQWCILKFAFEKLLIDTSKLDRLRPGKACRCLSGSSEVKNHLLSTLGNFIIIFVFE